MAAPLKQLDLFGMETSAPVHIAAPKQAKSIKQKKSLPQYRKPAYQATTVVEQVIAEPVQEIQSAHLVPPTDEAMPSVSRTPMAYVNRNILHKRGRKAFAVIAQSLRRTTRA